MRGREALLTLAAAVALAGADFSGASALEFTGRVVAFGERYPGSPGHRKVQEFIRREAGRTGGSLEEDSFTASTPRGKVRMTNFVLCFPGSSEEFVVLSGHYDTKRIAGVRFVGANDGGSSTGFLLEMGRALAERERKLTVCLVWFDGEEAFGAWSATDGLYGSRHLARKWRREGQLERIRALINVDMIGDRDLGILREGYSVASLMRLIRTAAAELGYGRYFFDERGFVEDDHVPFLRLGVRAANLIDFEFGEGNRYWHTAEDTLDKLDARSFQIVGEVVLRAIEKLESPR